MQLVITLEGRTFVDIHATCDMSDSTKDVTSTEGICSVQYEGG